MRPILPAALALGLLNACSSSQYFEVANQSQKAVQTLSVFQEGPQKSIPPGEVDKLIIAKGNSLEVPPVLPVLEASRGLRAGGEVVFLNELYELPEEFYDDAAGWDDRNWLGQVMNRKVGTLIYRAPGDVTLTTKKGSWSLRESTD